MDCSKVEEPAPHLRCTLMTFSAFGLLEVRGFFFIHTKRIYLMITRIVGYSQREQWMAISGAKDNSG